MHPSSIVQFSQFLGVSWRIQIPQIGPAALPLSNSILKHIPQRLNCTMVLVSWNPNHQCRKKWRTTKLKQSYSYHCWFTTRPPHPFVRFCLACAKKARKCNWWAGIYNKHPSYRKWYKAISVKRRLSTRPLIHSLLTRCSQWTRAMLQRHSWLNKKQQSISTTEATRQATARKKDPLWHCESLRWWKAGYQRSATNLQKLFCPSQFFVISFGKTANYDQALVVIKTINQIYPIFTKGELGHKLLTVWKNFLAIRRCEAQRTWMDSLSSSSFRHVYCTGVTTTDPLACKHKALLRHTCIDGKLFALFVWPDTHVYTGAGNWVGLVNHPGSQAGTCVDTAPIYLWIIVWSVKRRVDLKSGLTLYYTASRATAVYMGPLHSIFSC